MLHLVFIFLHPDLVWWRIIDGWHNVVIKQQFHCALCMKMIPNNQTKRWFAQSIETEIWHCEVFLPKISPRATHQVWKKFNLSWKKLHVFTYQCIQQNCDIYFQLALSWSCYVKLNRRYQLRQDEFKLQILDRFRRTW